jgi:hypothetical protein
MKVVKVLFMIVAIAAITVSCDKKVGHLPLPEPEPISGCDSIKYSVDIQPILNANCISCHSTGNPNGDYTNYAGTNVKVSSGIFANRVLVAKDMPLGGSLSESDLGKIKCWIDNGAPNN